MFDITTLAATDTSTLELVGADDAPLFDDKGKPLSITVYGPGSKVYQRAQARQQNQPRCPAMAGQQGPGQLQHPGGEGGERSAKANTGPQHQPFAPVCLGKHHAD